MLCRTVQLFEVANLIRYLKIRIEFVTQKKSRESLFSESLVESLLTPYCFVSCNGSMSNCEMTLVPDSFRFYSGKLPRI